MHKPQASAPAASPHVLLQFPHRGLQDLGIHGHLFVNGGNLSLLSGTGRSIHQVVSEDFTKRWRWTAVRFSCHFRVMQSSVPKLCVKLVLIRHALPVVITTNFLLVSLTQLNLPCPGQVLD